MREYFFIVMLVIFLIVNVYTVIRLSHHLPFIKRSLPAKLFLILFGFFFIISRILMYSYGKNILFDIMTFTGGLYLGFLNYMFFTFLIIDIYYIIKRVFRVKNKLKDKNVYRIGIAGAILIVAISFINGFIPVVKRYNIETKKELKEKIKLAVISDIHLSNISSPFYWRKVVSKVNLLNPDIIIIAGDMIDSDVDFINQEKYRDIFTKLKSKYGVYAVAGNHEYYGNLEKNIKFIESCNIKVLKDEYVNFENIILAGREDKHNKGRKKLSQILKNSEKSKFLIVADHNPSKLIESIEEKIDLQLSGHTHNGQFFPWNIPVYFMYENPKGILKKENTTVIVSSGIGVWGPVIRNCSRPEILEINIE
jgi:uncharacterized protein